MISLLKLVRVPLGLLILRLRHCLITAVLLPVMTCVGTELLSSLSPPVWLPDGTEFKTWEGKPSFSRTYYVDGSHPGAADSNPGTLERPFATINHAAQVLQPGERVIIAAGIYREQIIPARGGKGPDQMISYEAAPGARVILKGSSVFPEKWTLTDLSSSTQVWKVRLSPQYFGSYNPFNIENITPAQFDLMDWAEPLRGKPPCTLPRGLVFQDGRRLAQVTNLAALTGNEGCYCVDRTNQVVFATFFGQARPDNLVIEITTQETVFAPERPGLGYIRVKGLTLEQVAGPFPMEQVGCISTTRGHHWIIEDNNVRQVNGVGIDVGIQLGKWPQPAMTGFHIVRRNTVTDCGICGIAGLGPSGGKEFGLLMEDNVLLRNAFHDVEPLFETAGIKTHRNVRCLIRRNLVIDTLHGPGIWMDWDNRNSRCCQNVVINTHTMHGGIFVEASYVPNLVDQNVVWGTDGDGIYEHDSRHQVFAHNLVGKSTKSGLHLHGKITDRKVGPPPAEYGRHQVRNNLLYNNGKADLFGSQASTLAGNMSNGFAATLDPSSLMLTLAFTNAPSGAELVPQVTSDFFSQPRKDPKTTPGPFAQILPGPVELKPGGGAAKPEGGAESGKAPDPGRSILTNKPNDPRALLLSDFGTAGDGVADDSPAIQKAIDTLNRERGGQGIIFVPEGRYRLGSTINIWRGIRLIGFGRIRPVFVLGQDTPGFQEGEQKYLIHFRQNYPRPGQPPDDAMNDTFASGIININLKIESGNSAAIAMRYHVAQLCTLSYIDLELGDAEAGVEAIGNQITNCRFFGGKFGIRTRQTSAGWQALLMDCLFEGQKSAGVQTEWAGLTLVRCQFRNQPSAIVVPEGKNEHLYLRDCLMDGITQAALVVDTDQRPQSKLNMHNVICRNSPLLIGFRDGKQMLSPGSSYVVKTLSSGLQIENATTTSAARAQKTIWESTPLSGDAQPALSAPDVPTLPPQEEWANIVELGAKGDNQTDDTAVFRKAIAEHKVIYIPLGKYVINDTLELKPDTALIGLHPMNTLFVGAAGQDFSLGDAPKPMVVTPRGGTNFICGLGWQPARNPGIVHLKWQSGARSCLDDAFFSWGAGNSGAGAKYGLWVNGGGGTFRNIWTPNNCAVNGWYVSNTDVPGRVYLISVEHHSTVEAVFENVRNWLVCDLQTEIITSGPKTPGLQITDCQDMTFVNLFLFRAGTKEPFAYGAKLTGCGGITFLGLHNFNWGSVSYENSVLDTDSSVLIPEKEIARVTVRPAHKKTTLRNPPGTAEGDRPLPLWIVRSTDYKFEELLAGPEKPEDVTRWLAAMRGYRKEQQEVLKKALGEMPDPYAEPRLKWAQTSFIQPQMMMHDRYFFDPETRRYTVRRYLNDLRSRYGGIDSVLLWPPMYTNLGVDNRNQFDIWRDMPGGMRALRKMVAEFHREGVRVLIPIMNWDYGTRDEGIPMARGLARLCKELDADGLNGDTMYPVGREFYTESLAVDHPLALEPEAGMGRTIDGLAWNVLSWGYWWPDPQGSYPFKPAVDRYKWIEPRHLTHVCDRWAHDRTDMLQYAFFNGDGYESWENVFGVWNQVTPRDAEALRRIGAIYRAVPQAFASPDYEPFTPTIQQGVFATRFPGSGFSLYTLVNRTPAALNGPQLRVPFTPGARFFDLWRGAEFKPQIAAGQLTLAFPMEANGYGAVLVTTSSLHRNVKSLLAAMRKRAHIQLHTLSNEWKPRPQTIIEIRHTRPASRMPEGMIRIPGGAFRFEVEGVQDWNQEGLDVQYPWEDKPAFKHSRQMAVRSFYIDRTPVTCAEFKAFLDVTGYWPKDNHNFLRSWSARNFPAGWARKPVTWVSMEDARAYAKWAGKRLPHEWEWHYAAQGTDGRLYPWGNDKDDSRLPPFEQTRELRAPTDVDAYPQGASPFDVLDMVGNVWQWTDEYWDEHNRFAIVRGGSYYRPARSVYYFPQARKLNQHGQYWLLAPCTDRSGTIGFRCVVDAE